MKSSQRRIILDLLQAAGPNGIRRQVLEAYKRDGDIDFHYDRRIREIEEDYYLIKLNAEGRWAAPGEFIETFILGEKREPKGTSIPKERLVGKLPNGWEIFEVLAA